MRLASTEYMSMVRLARALPKGSSERRRILACLKKADDDLDSADRALQVYVRQHTYTPDTYTKELLARYPLTRTTKVYRGFMFTEEEKLQAFLDAMSKGTLTTKGLSSWTRSKRTAFQFAITKPNFHITRELAQLMDSNPGETLIGKGGVVIETTARSGQGIDVNTSDFAAEDEILLLSGTHKIRVVKVIRQYKEQLRGKDINKVFRELVTNNGWADLLRKGDSAETYDVGGLFQYIDDQHRDALDHENRISFGEISGRGSLDAGFQVEFNEVSWGDRPGRIRVSINPPLGLLAVGFFGSPAEARKEPRVQPLIDAVDDLVGDVVAEVRENPNAEIVFSGKRLHQLVQYGSPSAQALYKKMQRDTFGSKYHELSKPGNLTQDQIKGRADDILKLLKSIAV